MGVAVMIFLIPLAFFVACVLVIYLIIRAVQKRAQYAHEERMTAID